MNSTLHTYLPQDRYRALLKGMPLPEAARGAALFADISGFTSLTEKLTHKLGARRGIEELTYRINAVYDPLIGEVERYGGSVVNFAGDSITCWFDALDGFAPLRAVTCARAMQQAMQSFVDLGLKIAITTGPIRRLAVGDPTFQRMDTLAGSTVVRLSTGEHLAKQGEILLDEPTVNDLEKAITICEWRSAETNERFAVLNDLNAPAQPLSIETVQKQPEMEMLKPWVPPVVFEREQNGLGIFLTELRPAVALFLRFSGIDYDADEQASDKLDKFIRHVQAILVRHTGNLLQLTIGDKGSYLYASFGVPFVHEDDALRAARAAWELIHLPQEFDFLMPPQIGISKGTMRAGAYGGSTRLTYGALGDDTNLAARLMTTAAPGEILTSSRVSRRIGDVFNCEPRPPLAMKGKAEPLPVFAITGLRRQRAIRLEEPIYTLPMMGRQSELAVIREKLALAQQGHGQIIGIQGEAGMGKSRLVAEAIRLAHQSGFAGYGGACEASGANSPYLVWKPIWQAFFDVDPASPARRQLRNLEAEIEDRAPARLSALPVLTTLLEIEIEDNDFTRNLEPKDRRNVLTVLLEDCLKSAAQEEPHLLVLEDVHWIDPSSQDLLENLARICISLPVCILLAYRSAESQPALMEHLESLPHFTKLELSPLNEAEVEQLMRTKLAQLYPEHTARLSEKLADAIFQRAEGNPFYIEELLNYLRDRGLNPYDVEYLEALDLPPSLHALILSRIDQLSETQKITLKVASIIGRLFQVTWLIGYYPDLGPVDRVKANLAELARLDLTPLDTPEPELAYFFKHMLTREVAYESLAFATRARLHEQLARYIEGIGEERFLDLIAYHYGLSGNIEKQRQYYQKAGDAAKKAYANQTALEYYQRLEPLLDNPQAKIQLHLKRGGIFELIGEWEEAEQQYRAALEDSQRINEPTSIIYSQKGLGTVFRMRGDFAAALEWLTQANEKAAQSGDGLMQAQVLREIGKVEERLGKVASAQERCRLSLKLAKEHQDQKLEALALSTLASILTEIGEYNAAQGVTEEGLQLMQELGDRQGIATALNRLGLLAGYQGNLIAAQSLYEQSIAIGREIGDKLVISSTLNNLAVIANRLGRVDEAQVLYTECLTISQEIGDQWSVAHVLINLGVLAVDQADYRRAQMLFDESLVLLRQLEDTPGVATVLLNLGYMACKREDFSKALATIAESLRLFEEINSKWGIVYCLAGLAAVAAARANFFLAARLASAAEAHCNAIHLSLETDGSQLLEDAITAARAVLPPEAFEQAWKTGEYLTLKEIFDLIQALS